MKNKLLEKIMSKSNPLGVGDILPDAFIDDLNSLYEVMEDSEIIFILSSSCETCIEVLDYLKINGYFDVLILIEGELEFIAELRSCFKKVYRADYSKLKESLPIPVTPYIYKVNQEKEILMSEICYDISTLTEILK